MRKKWEYSIAHIDPESGFMLRDFNHAEMADVFELATPGPKGTYGQGEVLRIAGSLGWELVCPVQDQCGTHWYFKRELEK